MFCDNFFVLFIVKCVVFVLLCYLISISPLVPITTASECSIKSRITNWTESCSITHSQINQRNPDGNKMEDEWMDIMEQSLRTGLEFITDSFEPDLSSEFYLGNDTFSLKNLKKVPLLKLVRMFIRNLKGLPREELRTDFPPGGTRNDDYHKPDWSYFPYELKKLAEIEINIYWILKEFYSKQNNFHFPLLESYLQDIRESSLLAIALLRNSKIQAIGESEDHYLYIGSHPLLIYRMIRRFADDLQPILTSLQDQFAYVIESITEKANPNLEIFPTKLDLKDALESIERIQMLGDVKTEDFVKGILGKVNTGLNVNALQALEIGVFLLSRDKYDLGLQWIYLAFETISTSPTAHKFPVIFNFFLKVLEHAVNEHNEQHEERAKNLTSPGVFVTKLDSGELNPFSFRRQADLNMERAILERYNKNWDWHMELNYIQVCSGVTLLTPKEQAELKCMYFNFLNAYWLIGPLKMEILHLEPTVLQIYDFIGNELSEKARNASVNRLKRSQVAKQGENAYSDSRTSSQTWLFDYKGEGEFMKGFTKRLELLSGLIIYSETDEASDAYQAATYGPSHHYSPHLDSFSHPGRIELKGNRIVTIMAYLNDVSAGGRTGFPVLGIFAEPVKGSIVMWENLENDVKSPDLRTRHGGCPVLLGVKWILTKWVYDRENMFRYLCKDKVV